MNSYIKNDKIPIPEEFCYKIQKINSEFLNDMKIYFLTMQNFT